MRPANISFFLSSRSFGALLLLWFTTYVVFGLSCAFLYASLTCGVVDSSTTPRQCIHDGPGLLYFSFITQATVGFGDYIPLGGGRSIAVLQSFLGTTMNAVLLGVAVFKLLKRPSPYIFPNVLVYEPDRHGFWFRFMSIDPDTLKDVNVDAYLIKTMGQIENNARKTYDTLTSTVELPFQHYPMRPHLNITALRTVSNGGQTTKDHPGNFQPVKLSPAHLISDFRDSDIQITLEINGYFATTGDRFFAAKSYGVEDIRCGVYKDINNNSLSHLPTGKKEALLRQQLNDTESTVAAECLRCPFHSTCIFDVAVATREVVRAHVIAHAAPESK
jgi:hypothetical protein